MKKAMFLMGFLGICGLLLASDEPADFSGTWILDAKKSFVRGRALDENEKAPLVIVQTENEIRISVSVSGRRLGYESFRLDGEKALIPGPQGAGLTVKTRLKGNKLEIEKENRYSGRISKTWSKYSLSKDGKTLKLESPGRTLVYKKVDTMPGSASQPENPGPQAEILKPESLSAAAIESVKKQRPDRKLHFVVAGGPVVRPDPSPLPGKRSSDSQRSAAARRFPDAFVTVDIYRGSRFQEKAVVVFMNRKQAVQFYGQKSERSSFSEDVMDGEEVRKVAEGMDSFFKTALDISQSSERFNAFLPENIRSLFKHPDRKFRMHMPPGAIDPSWKEMLSKAADRPGRGPLDGVDGWREKLSDKELRRFLSLSLDFIFQQIWLSFEGLEGDPGTQLKPALLISNPPEYMKLLEKSTSLNRRLLEEEGVLTPEHLRRASDYMRQLLGPCNTVKEVAKSEMCPCFLLPYLGEGYIYNRASELEARNKIPSDAKLYSFQMANLNFHFSIEDTNTRIVCIAMN